MGKTYEQLLTDVDKEYKKISTPISNHPTKTLKLGDKGEAVKELQRLLINKNYKLTPDGDFGKMTETAVKDFQKKNQLTVDGIVGEKSFGKLV